MNLNVTNEEKWKFSPIPNIEESNFNKILERFYNMGIKGLTRENAQNSLDGRLPGNENPVILTIETGSIKKANIPGINEVIERIKCLEGRNGYTKETIQHMVNKINQEEVRYISFEDSNTRGLTGARNGQSGSKKDTWGIYAYSKGVHFEEEDSSLETSRGGSHGVGKIASNAASDLHLMYFANCDENGDKHLGGTVQLIEHLYKGHCYRSTGYFTDIKLEGNKSKFYPYENNFDQVFEKNTRGLKIIIPYFREEYDNEREIIRSICDSFFLSILEGKLKVIVNEKEVTNDTILNYIKDPEYYVQDITEAKKVFTPLYVDTYLNETPEVIKVSDGVEDYHFNLYFYYDEQIPKGRVAIVRTIGMKIEDFKIEGKATKPFNAVLIGSSAEDKYLKLLENESHTKLSPDDIKDPNQKKRAKKFMSNLSREISKVIEEAIKKNNPTDGQMNTADILYVLETQFKKDLSDTLGTVMINDGNKPLVKTSSDVPIKEKRERKDSKQGSKKNPGPSKKKRDPLKRQKSRDSDKHTEKQEQLSTIYSAHPDMVERLIVGNKEMVKFDFTKSEHIKNDTYCNISLAVIDGMGVEYPNEFNIQDNYNHIIDLNSGGNCPYSQNVINNVQITQGVAQLELNLKESLNKSLKFVYYVEV
ncbi:hypothetical protein [Pontibacillus yanchengensis]|uniref:Uncharacterized protein n=1 Tax=Pontibacillus yanchengensis Y32 TaxID=1385514 RepID=A0A0A2TK72_9BACI|nr:hypothetical protein [Pontibacillus yanchengensis]KGP74486.1 hypothetical protein N782_12700 [Pontibacillus yanchengensis Y32]